MERLLELIDFHYYYGSIHAVKGVSLYVDEGEIVTLIGANGSGKSTTLQSIQGLTDRSGIRGKILFNGKEIQNIPGYVVSRLGFAQAIEGRRIFSRLTVEENLHMGAFNRSDTKGIKDDIEDVFKRFPRLLERRGQMGGTLSGGEQQMLAIGRALMQRPRLLLLDEPSLGLAPLIIKEIFKAIRDISNGGMTVLFVEQNSKIALETASRGYIFQTGEIITSGLCSELTNDPKIKEAYLGI